MNVRNITDSWLRAHLHIKYASNTRNDNVAIHVQNKPLVCFTLVVWISWLFLCSVVQSNKTVSMITRIIMSRDMRFPTMWYVRPANSQISLCIRAVWSESLLVAWIFVKQLTEYSLKFLSLRGGKTDSSESTLVKMPRCWKSHVVAQYLDCYLSFNINKFYDRYVL